MDRHADKSARDDAKIAFLLESTFFIFAPCVEYL